MALLDTSVVVRYLTGDPPDLQNLAAAVIDGPEILYISDVALAEAAFVLTSVYRVPRATVVDHLVAFLGRANIEVLGPDKGLVIQALLMCRPSGRVSIADALIWAVARSSEDRVVYTMDDRFPADGIIVRRGP